MENKINVKEVETQISKTCKCCGKTLPITQFYRIGRGHRNVCKTCFCELTHRSPQFAEFGDNTLILELQRRGYHGDLIIEVVKTKTI